jgi:hypothetical protein
MKIEKLKSILYDEADIEVLEKVFSIYGNKINELIDAFNSLPKPMWSIVEKEKLNPIKEKESEVLRCPFCGLHAFISQCGNHWEIGCNSDHDSSCIKPMRDGYLTKEEAIADWNKRA